MRAALSMRDHQISDRHPYSCKGNSIPDQDHLPPLFETYFPHRTMVRSASPGPSHAHRHGHGVPIWTTSDHLAQRILGRQPRPIRRSNRETMPDNRYQVRSGGSRFPHQRAAASESSFFSHTIKIGYRSSDNMTITYYPTGPRTYFICSDPTRIRVRRPADSLGQSVQL